MLLRVPEKFNVILVKFNFLLHSKKGSHIQIVPTVHTVHLFTVFPNSFSSFKMDVYLLALAVSVYIYLPILSKKRTEISF